MTVAEETPSRAYYGRLTGQWTGRFQLSVVRPEAVGATSLLTRIVALVARWSGSASMTTTLQEETPNRFQHTTRVTRFGFPLLASSESITLDADGRSFVIEGWQRFLWLREPYRAVGQVLDDASGATYPISWLSAPMEQTTAIEGPTEWPTLRLRQSTAWSEGEVLLSRTR